MYRVQKILSLLGILSRRDCESKIMLGLVKINNELAKIGSKVSIGDKITYVSSHVVGYQVKNSSNELIGELKDVMWLPNNDVYVIQNYEKEILVPVISEFVKQIRHDKKLIIIEPIEGLLD